jgi:hypothetical protein
MNKETACGGRKRKGNYGAQSMDREEMGDFILKHGTKDAIAELKRIGVKKASRGQLCVIFHMFAAGLHQISMGVNNKGKVKSPERVASPKRKSPERVVSPKRNAPRRARPNNNWVYRREHMFGPMVLGRRPPRRARSLNRNNRGVQNNRGVNVNYLLNNMYARRNNNARSNYGNNNNGRSNGGGSNYRSNNNAGSQRMVQGANYINFGALRKNNKKVNAVEPTRLNPAMKYLSQIAELKPRGPRLIFSKHPRFKKANQSVHLENLGFEGLNFDPVTNEAVVQKPRFEKPVYPMMVIPHTQGFLRVPTRPWNRGGTKARSSNSQLAQANKFRNKMLQVRLSQGPRMSPKKQATLANVLLNLGLRNANRPAAPVIIRRKLPTPNNNSPPKKRSHNYSPNRKPKKVKYTGKRAEIMKKLKKKGRGYQKNKSQ